MEKLYCYVDETGQDTFGNFFIVAVVIVASERDELALQLHVIEKQTGKDYRKWVKSKSNFDYMVSALTTQRFEGKIFYKIHSHTKQYDKLTIQTVAEAIKTYTAIHNIDHYKATIIVDGLKAKQESEYATALRQKNISIAKTKGARDQSDALLRLSDTVAGLIRESEEGRITYRALRKRFERAGIFEELF